MADERYPAETLGPDDDDGTIVGNVETLEAAVIGRRIVSAGKETVPHAWRSRGEEAMVLTLDDGRRVILADTDDCCAYTELESFLLDPAAVDHVILGVGTTDGYSTWHIYADFGDVMKLEVGWSCGNPFFYGYGFDIRGEDVGAAASPTGESA